VQGWLSMKKLWLTNFNPLVVSGIVLSMGSSSAFSVTALAVEKEEPDAEEVVVKKTAPTSKSAPTPKATKPIASEKTSPSAKNVLPASAPSKPSTTKTEEKTKSKKVVEEDNNTEEDVRDKEVDKIDPTENDELQTKSAKKSTSDMASIKDKPASEKDMVADIPLTDKPIASVVQETEVDTHAKAVLEIADNHRNHRTHFSAIESWKEALRLYQDIATTQAPVSPDLKARSIINLIEMTVWSPFGDVSSEKKLEALHRIIEVTQNTAYSPDVKGWAKRHLAKLYLLGGFDLEPIQAKTQALALLEEIIADQHVLQETRARTMIQLAHHYANSLFNISDKDALEKATKLLTDVFSSTNTRDALRIEAKMLLASISNPYTDVSNAKRLKLLRDIISDKKASSSEQAKAKERLAHYYLIKLFDVPLAESRAEARKLLKELATDTSLAPQEQINHYVKLAEHYIHVKLDLKPSESRAEALKMYQDLPSKIQLNVLQNYVYQKELAHYCVINAFHQDPLLSKQIALKVYHALLNDTTLSPPQRAEINWTVANLYITKQLDPQTGGDGKAEGLALIKQVISDPKINFEIVNQFKLNLAILFESNAFGILPSKAREEAASLLMELLADNRISVADKQQIQMRLDLLNKTR
jgi:hypothetical protein